MNRIAIVGDTHLGRHARDALTRDHIESGQDAFFDFLVKDLKSKNIDTIIFTGDIHDHRTFLNIRTACKTKKLLEETLKDFKVIIVQGNHDLYYKDSYEISSLMLFDHYDNVEIYQEKGKKINIFGKDWYIIPWVIEDREEKFEEFLKTLSARTKEEKDNTVILGHFELDGIKMEGNAVSTSGMDFKYLTDSAKLIISGHYHGTSETVSGDSTLLYVGSPYPLTFINANEKHGYFILNEDLTYEFIENTVSPRFIRVSDVEILNKNVETLENCFVEVSYKSNMTDEQYLELTTLVDSLKPITKRYIPYQPDEPNDIKVIQEALDDEESIPELSIDIADLACKVVDIRPDSEIDKNKVKEMIIDIIGKIPLS